MQNYQYIPQIWVVQAAFMFPPAEQQWSGWQDSAYTESGTEMSSYIDCPEGKPTITTTECYHRTLRFTVHELVHIHVDVMPAWNLTLVAAPKDPQELEQGVWGLCITKSSRDLKKKKNLLAEFWQLLLKPDERSKKCHHAERHPCSLHDRWVTPHEASNCWKSMYCNLIPLICMLIIPNTHTILCCWLIKAILALQFSLIAARCSLWARSWFGWGVINTPWKQLNSY